MRMSLYCVRSAVLCSVTKIHTESKAAGLKIPLLRLEALIWKKVFKSWRVYGFPVSSCCDVKFFAESVSRFFLATLIISFLEMRRKRMVTQ